MSTHAVLILQIYLGAIENRVPPMLQGCGTTFVNWWEFKSQDSYFLTSSGISSNMTCILESHVIVGAKKK